MTTDANLDVGKVEEAQHIEQNEVSQDDYHFLKSPSCNKDSSTEVFIAMPHFTGASAIHFEKTLNLEPRSNARYERCRSLQLAKT